MLCTLRYPLPSRGRPNERFTPFPLSLRFHNAKFVGDSRALFRRSRRGRRHRSQSQQRACLPAIHERARAAEILITRHNFWRDRKSSGRWNARCNERKKRRKMLMLVVGGVEGSFFARMRNSRKEGWLKRGDLLIWAGRQ